MTSFIPAAANRTAIARPIPRFAPVTRATLEEEFGSDEAVIPEINAHNRQPASADSTS
jgi:hypothetical protein